MYSSPRTQKRLVSSHPGIYDSKRYNGTLLIADISGFSKFVHKTELSIGKRVTFRLLTAIMESNILNLDISEIEGDAVLFYKYEGRFTTEEILDQYEVMLESFNHELLLLSEEFGESIELSLKLIVHFGVLAEYQIGKFQKLYGETVIEAHKLLKNSIKSSAYVILTNDFLKSTLSTSSSGRKGSISGNKICYINGGLRNICFTFFDYQKKATALPL